MMAELAMFAVAQPSPGRLQNLNRKKNWDDAEDECLCRCWIKAVEQHKAPEHKSAEFWRIVTEMFQNSTPREEERSDDACNQRFNNLSRACTKWLLARETVLSNPLNQGKDEDQLSDVTQDAYKRLMNTDKSFKHFRVLDLLKNNEKWQEHSQALSARTREQVASGLSGAGKVRMPPIGQKMKLGRAEFPGPSAEYQRVSTLLMQVQSSMTQSLEKQTESNRDLGEKVLMMGSELGKKVDSLCEVLLLRNLPEGDRKTLIDAQLKQRMRSLESQEQEERKRKLMAEIEVLELEGRKKAMLEKQQL